MKVQQQGDFRNANGHYRNCIDSSSPFAPLQCEPQRRYESILKVGDHECANATNVLQLLLLAIDLGYEGPKYSGPREGDEPDEG